MTFNDPSFQASRFGVSGGIDATICYLSGRAIVPGDVRVQLDETRYIRVNAMVWSGLARADKDAIKAEALASFPASEPVMEAPAQTVSRLKQKAASLPPEPAHAVPSPKLVSALASGIGGAAEGEETRGR